MPLLPVTDSTALEAQPETLIFRDFSELSFSFSFSSGVEIEAETLSLRFLERREAGREGGLLAFDPLRECLVESEGRRVVESSSSEESAVVGVADADRSCRSYSQR